MIGRINGHSNTNRLGYFIGDNAIVSVALSNENQNINIKDTGAVASFNEIKHHLNSDDLDIILHFIKDQKITKINGDFFTDTSDLELEYNKSYCAQINLNRIIDIIQQRAVILSTSNIAENVKPIDFYNVIDGVYSTTNMDKAIVFSVLVERASVFNKDSRSYYGVPTGQTEKGRNLVEDMFGVKIYLDDSTEVKLKGSSNPNESGNFGVRIYNGIPALFN